MTAVERALRHLEKLMARGKPAKRKTPAKKRQPAKKARVVSRAARHTRPSAYSPPRHEPDVVELVEAFAPAPAPAPTPPAEPGPISPALYQPMEQVQVGDMVYSTSDQQPGRVFAISLPTWAAAFEAAQATAAQPPVPAAPVDPTPRVLRGSCKAVCAATGLKCRLPAHDMATPHSNERGQFHRVAVPGQTHFAARATLEEFALRSPDVSTPYERRSDAQEQRAVRSRRSAHAGDVTTEDGTHAQALAKHAQQNLAESGGTHG